MENIYIDVIKEIDSIKDFSLELYYDYIKKYGKDFMLKIIRHILKNSKNENEVYNKFLNVILCIEFDSKEFNETNIEKLTNKYGENVINQFFSDMYEFNNTDNLFKNIYENINKIIQTTNKPFETIDIIGDEENDSDENNIAFNNLEENEDSYIYDDPVKSYLMEIGEIPLLSAEEEKYLAERIACGDQYAKNKLIESNLKLVVSIAKRHVGRGIHILDLIQEGNIGLMKATEKFNPALGNRFSTYAIWWIRQAITRVIADQSKTIRIPVHMNDLINKIVKLQSVFMIEKNRNATVKEISLALNIPEEKIEDAIKHQIDLVSLDIPCSSDEDVSLVDFVADTTSNGEEFFERERREKIEACLATLTEREATVLKLRNGWGNGKTHTLEEVGQIYGLTRERIRQIENKAIRKLRNPARKRILEDLY